MNEKTNDRSYFHEFGSEENLIQYLKRPESEWNPEIGKYDFEQCLFTFDVRFEHLTRGFEEQACFKQATFSKSVSFEGLTFKKLADFNGCTFNDVSSFRDSTFEDEVYLSSFHGHVSFRNAKFKSSTFFWNHFYKGANFAYSTFSKTVDFSNTVFEGDVNFNDATFEEEAYFEEAEFKCKVNAWKITFNKEASFKWSNFRAKVNMSETTALAQINMHGVNFEGNAYFYDSNLHNLDIEKSVIDKGVFFLGAQINIANRETFRTIKHEFLKQNNRIEALKYHAREMEQLRMELKEKDHSGSESNSNWDNLILNLNKWTNYYGLNPGNGIVSTITISIFFFGLYWISLESKPTYFTWPTSINETLNGLGITFSYLAEFTSPVHSIDFMKTYIGSWSVIIDVVSRVFIGFCIYQTIQAFRKYGRF